MEVNGELVQSEVYLPSGALTGVCAATQPVRRAMQERMEMEDFKFGI